MTKIIKNKNKLNACPHGCKRSSVDLLPAETGRVGKNCKRKKHLKIPGNCLKGIQQMKTFFQENLLNLSKNSESVALELSIE